MVSHQQMHDVAQWRKRERERLIAERLALSAESRAMQAKAIAKDLDAIIAACDARIVGVYWPIRARSIRVDAIR